MNGTLQPQRLAHEAVGYGVWTQCDKDVPTAAGYHKLARLDLHDPKHPKLLIVIADKPQAMNVALEVNTHKSAAADTDKNSIGSDQIGVSREESMEALTITDSGRL